MTDEVSGVDRRTGEPLTGWPWVVQSIVFLMTTPYFSVVMAPWLGSPAHRLIGELANVRNAQRFRWALAMAIDLFVPNFEVSGIDLVTLDETGATEWVIDGTYWPRGHLGDFTDGVRKSVTSADASTVGSLLGS